MNKKTMFAGTTNYEDGLVEDLQNQEEARVYLEAAFEAYNEDGNTDALFLALEHVAKAKGRIENSQYDLENANKYCVFADKYNLQLNNWLIALSALGFRIRLESQNIPTKTSSLQEQFAL